MNIFRDRRGIAMTAAEPQSVDTFESALRQLQSYRGDAIATIDTALAQDPGFVSGHIFRAEVCITMWERAFKAEAEKSLHELETLTGMANDRERAHIAAISDWMRGDWEGMRHRFDRILDDHPTDALALQIGHIADFYHGDRDNLRGRVARAFPFWSSEMPGYGFVHGMLSFGLEECGDYRRAEEVGRRAIELEPDDCWAQHAVTHVMEMESRQEEGIEWMQSRRDHWAQDDNAFAYHNWWHTALYHLDLGRIDRVLEIYDASVRPGEMKVQLQMLDSAALLWRLHLQDRDTGDRWAEVADAYETIADEGFYVFNDMHAMMSYAATGRSAAAQRLLQAVDAASSADGTNALMSASVGRNIVRAIDAFGRESYGETVDLLLPIRYRAHVFGGSHAQRDIIHRTLIESAFRSGRYSLARSLTVERTALKPHCPFSLSLQRRAEESLSIRALTEARTP
ncbi:MAG TPA: tetratricopeptide repeat protein [Thermoanaerobaculia bacterium]